MNDAQRNRLIVGIIREEAAAGHSCLVLSQRISHIQKLQTLLNGQDPAIKTGLITGKEPETYRNAAIEQARTGEIAVLFSCRLADEGLDVPKLDRLFLVAPIRSTSRLIQQIGRIKRPFPGKKDAIVFDFLDDCISLAKSQFYTRSGVYKSQNIPMKRLLYNGYRNPQEAD